MSEQDKGPSMEVRPGKQHHNYLRYVPYFLFILILYIIVKGTVGDLHTTLGKNPSWAISWGEVLLILAAVFSLAEQMKVSHPGDDNTTEALTMVGMGGVQLVLFVLGVAQPKYFGIFADSSFLVQTIISLSAAIVAVRINARTLRRTMSWGGDN